MSREQLRNACLAFALLASTPAVPALADDDAPWIELSGTEVLCRQIVYYQGLPGCVEGTATKRKLVLSREGLATLQLRTEPWGPLAHDPVTETSYAGCLSREDLRGLRSYLAAIDIGHQTASCNAFQNTPFDDPRGNFASYQLIWNGPGDQSVTLPFATFQTPVCPQPLVRLLYRLNRLAATLPVSPGA